MAPNTAANMKTQHIGEFFVVQGPSAALSRSFVTLDVPDGAFAVCRRSTWGPLWWDRVVHPDRPAAEAAAAAYELGLDEVSVKRLGSASAASTARSR